MATKSKAKKLLNKSTAVAKKKIRDLDVSHSPAAKTLPHKDKKLGGIERMCSTANCYMCKTTLDNQVRIIFGLAVGLFVILGFNFSYHFFTLSGVLGVIYAISGLMNKCYIKEWLRCVPCNKTKELTVDKNGNKKANVGV